jgi:hypothetical protein
MKENLTNDYYINLDSEKIKENKDEKMINDYYIDLDYCNPENARTNLNNIPKKKRNDANILNKISLSLNIIMFYLILINKFPLIIFLLYITSFTLVIHTSTKYKNKFSKILFAICVLESAYVIIYFLAYIAEITKIN